MLGKIVFFGTKKSTISLLERFKDSVDLVVTISDKARKGHHISGEGDVFDYTSKNNKALKFLSSKKIIIKEFPKEVLDSLREISIKVIKEIGSTDKITREVYLSYMKFKEEVMPWTKLSEKSYINSRD